MTKGKVFILGLTGSIGMGKSTTAGFFEAEGVPVWDADAAVHRLYSKGGAAVDPVGGLCPEAVKNSAIDRNALKGWISRDDSALKKLESIVHPLVARDRATFLEEAGLKGSRIAVVDIPLLFETGAENWCDATLVVTASPDIQKARVMERKGMTEAMFQTILGKQMPDAEKREKADYVVETRSLPHARSEVQALLNKLMG